MDTDEEVALQALIRLRMAAAGLLRNPEFQVRNTDVVVYEVGCVKRHRLVKGQLQFLTVYKGYEDEGAHWQPAGDFADANTYNIVVKEYCLKHQINWPNALQK
jgi:hypothetical protein